MIQKKTTWHQPPYVNQSDWLQHLTHS